jgi:hypothetical protein
MISSGCCRLLVHVVCATVLLVGVACKPKTRDNEKPPETPPQAPESSEPLKQDRDAKTIGLGNLNVIGHSGSGGSGPGYDRAQRGELLPPMRAHIELGEIAVKGAVPKADIQNVVERQINELLYCYERSLPSRPDIEGEVRIKYIISHTGAVMMSTVASSTLGNPGTENCMAQTFRRFTFPKPSQKTPGEESIAVVTVSLRLSLRPRDETGTR